MHPDASPSTPPDPFDVYDAREREDRARMQDAVWTSIGTLWNWRRFIVIVTGLAAVAAVLISLLALPTVYTASTRLLLPSTGSSASAMLGDLGSAARSLLGVGSGGDYTRYLALMTSRSLQNEVVDEFDLLRVYEIEVDDDTSLEKAQQDAREELSARTGFHVDEEFEYLSISVTDEDPERAARMTNFYVAELTAMSQAIGRKSSGSFLGYMEQRYAQATVELDSVLDATMRFQERYGVYDLPAQTEGFLVQIAQVRGEMQRAEIEYQALRSQLGDDNPRVRQMRAVVDAAGRTYERALSGQERIMPVAQGDIPLAAREYADLELQRRIQASLLEVVVPVLEQARFDQLRDRPAFEVVDVAVPPVKKSGPKRSYICIVTTLSAFVLAVVFVLLYEAWQRYAPIVEARFQDGISRSRRA